MCQINNILICWKPNKSGSFDDKTENGNSTEFKIKELRMVRFGVLYDGENAPDCYHSSEQAKIGYEGGTSRFHNHLILLDDKLIFNKSNSKLQVVS